MGRVKKQHTAPDQAGKTFPPRKRSIPYGFDFDLDEVWAPNNPHLTHLKHVSGSSGDKARGSKSQGSKFSSCQVSVREFSTFILSLSLFSLSERGPRVPKTSPRSLIQRQRYSRRGTLRPRPSRSSATSPSSATTWRVWL